LVGSFFSFWELEALLVTSEGASAWEKDGEETGGFTFFDAQLANDPKIIINRTEITRPLYISTSHLGDLIKHFSGATKKKIT